jgi:hypothetical protein
VLLLLFNQEVAPAPEVPYSTAPAMGVVLLAGAHSTARLSAANRTTVRVTPNSARVRPLKE